MKAKTKNAILSRIKMLDLIYVNSKKDLIYFKIYNF